MSKLSDQIRQEYREAVASAIEGKDDIEAWGKVYQSLAQSIFSAWLSSVAKNTEGIEECEVAKLIFAKSDCGAGTEGNAGFQPGNTCAGEGGGEAESKKRKRRVREQDPLYPDLYNEDVEKAIDGYNTGSKVNAYTEILNLSPALGDELKTSLETSLETFDYLYNQFYQATLYSGTIEKPKEGYRPPDDLIDKIETARNLIEEFANKAKDIQTLPSGKYVKDELFDETKTLVSELYLKVNDFLNSYTLERLRHKNKFKIKGDGKVVDGVTVGKSPKEYNTIEDFVDSYSLKDPEDAEFLWLVHEKEANTSHAKIALEAVKSVRKLLVEKGVKIPDIDIGFGFQQRRGKASHAGAKFYYPLYTDENLNKVSPTSISLNHRGFSKMFAPYAVKSIDDLWDENGDFVFKGLRLTTVTDMSSAERWLMSDIVHEIGHQLHMSRYANEKLEKVDITSAFKDMSNSNEDEIIKHASKYETPIKYIYDAYHNKLEHISEEVSQKSLETPFEELQEKITKNVSVYASSSQSEFVAEMFCKMILNPFTKQELVDNKELIDAYIAYGGSPIKGQTDRSEK